MAATVRRRGQMMKPIGTFFAESKYPYEARRQAVDASHSLGEIRLNSGMGFEQAVEDLEGFERIWIIYQFHHNSEWKPKVMPPRGPRIRRGVFATRAPYRPNALGMSCVRLVKVDGLRVIVEGHDLLDGTPVLDGWKVVDCIFGSCRGTSVLA
jgi:tRNA (adenine37-N6)-methyltransferase